MHSTTSRFLSQWDLVPTHQKQQPSPPGNSQSPGKLGHSNCIDHQALQNLTNTVKELSNQIKAKDRQIKDLIKAMNSNTTIGKNTRSTWWEKKDCGS